MGLLRIKNLGATYSSKNIVKFQYILGSHTSGVLLHTLAPQLTNIRVANIQRYKRELTGVYLFYIFIYWILYREFFKGHHG